MSERIVTTQSELDAALSDGVEWIEIRSERGIWIELSNSGSATVHASGSATVHASGSATVHASGSATVRAYGSATVHAYGSATVHAYDSATVRASGSATVHAYGSATVHAYDSATVHAYDSATVRAYGSATVHAYDSATVRAYGSATVRAYGSATVRAYDSATVHAYDSATVHAYGSATVHAYDSATVRAYGSATVRAYGSATVHAYGSATVRAGSHTAVHLHSGHARVDGGVIIDHLAVDESDPQVWCDYHGAIVEDGIATVYKAVNDSWTTDRGTDYSPGSLPSCDDFKPTNDCGNGLHFGPTPGHALAYHLEATRFVAVGVRLDEMQVITGDGTAKVKAPRVVRACVEVDEHGRVLATDRPEGER